MRCEKVFVRRVSGKSIADMVENAAFPHLQKRFFCHFQSVRILILLCIQHQKQEIVRSRKLWCSTKSAIHFLTKSLVKELEPKQIRVNAIAPGFIETSWHKNRTPESYERINRKIALHRFGEISEVADMAYEVLKNGYMNGSVVDIHGGYDYF